MIDELLEEPGYPLAMAAIAERPNTAGYRVARGKAFTRSTVHRLLCQKPSAAPIADPFSRRN